MKYAPGSVLLMGGLIAALAACGSRNDAAGTYRCGAPIGTLVLSDDGTFRMEDHSGFSGPQYGYGSITTGTYTASSKKVLLKETQTTDPVDRLPNELALDRQPDGSLKFVLTPCARVK